MRTLTSNRTRPRPGARRERGTVLLMVVGVLALIAIIAILYGAIGQADRRASAAYVRAVALDDQAGRIAEYISGIIGKSTFDSVRESGYGSWAPTQGRGMHTLADYPSLDTAKRTDPTIGPGTDPISGRNVVRYSPLGGTDRPWLAPTDPTRVGKTPLADTSGMRPYLDQRDWDSITNIAPDGRFVNLANLRNNFEAEPGVGLAAGGKPRMSQGLTLFGSNGLPFNPSMGAPLLEDGTTSDPNIPWHWTRRQIWAFRPVRELGNSGVLPDPAEDAYYLNQWADADGDGMGDSRWFELVDSTTAGKPQTLLPLNRARIFVAVRIVDLSARINVNTAGDIGPADITNVRVPGAVYPVGSTPTDIDLRRVLEMGDVYASCLKWPSPDQPVAYDGLEQPRVPVPPGTGPSVYIEYQSPAVGAAVGDAAYGALRAAIFTGRVPPAGFVAEFISAQARFAYYDGFAFDPMGARRYTGAADRSGTLSPLGLGDAAELLTFDRVNDPERTSTLEDITGGRYTNQPHLDPLRSNRPLLVERGGRSNRFNPSTGFPDADALLQGSIDVRHRVTTISGSRPLTSVVSPADAAAIGTNPNVLKPSELRVDARFLLSYGAGNGQTPGPQAVNQYFSYLADCLMPYRDVLPTSSPSWDNTPPTTNPTLCYGWRGMETAYRLTGHLAANTLAAMHPPTIPPFDPPAYSLHVDKTVPITGALANTYPFDQLALPDAEIKDAGPGGPLASSANVNIFGIVPQAFITEMASFTFYTDTPHTLGGDDEWQGTPGHEVTIDGTISDANHDFLAEVIAFQITNPFEYEVTLTQADGKLLYYIEYAGRCFQLARISGAEPAGVRAALEKISLLPGQTRVFYATSPRTAATLNARFTFQNRVPAANMPPPNFPADFLQQWAAVRFGPNAVQMLMVDRATGTPIAPSGGTGLMDLFGRNVSLTAGQQKVAYLWRVMRAGTTDINPGSPNDPANDFLADRLHEQSAGADSVLRQRIPSGAASQDVPGSEAGDETSGTPGVAEDNTGFTIVLWAAVRRPTNPAAAGAPQGAMPPWCIEAKLDQFYGVTPYNQNEQGPTTDRGNAGEYGLGSNGISRYRKIAFMRGDQMSAASTSVNQQIRREPRNKTGNPVPASQYKAINAVTFATFNEQALELHFGDPSVTTNPPTAASGLFKRTGDLLLPLAIGPSHDPTLPPIAGASGYVGEQEGRWTCLSEVLALAMDYYSPPLTTPSGLPEIFYKIAHRDGTSLHPALDRGNLVIDDFVPFIDIGGPGGAPNGLFDPGIDRTLGLGIPLALNILDKFRMNDYGSLTQSVPGQLNINTAPVFNMQALPMLSPDQAGWATDTMTTYPSQGLYQPATQTQDGATILAAYREKVLLHTRRPLVTPPVPGQLIDFTDSNNTAAPAVPGRQFATMITGLREDPGFRSIGEVLATSIHQIQPDRYPAGMVPDPTLDNLDRYAHDQHSINQPGVDTPLYRNGAIVEDDKIADEFDEKLAVANAVLNSITTRSDVFCVWFVVHGYLPSDVEVGADGANPMVPSIARRYMMVVDRSNVVKATDKPRILLMQEVPM